MISEEFSSDVHAFFDQLTIPVHPISAPLTFVKTALAPVVHSQAFSLVLAEITDVSVACRPLVLSVAVLLPLEELAFVGLSDFQHQSSLSMLDIVLPLSVVDVSILVLVGTSVAQVVVESALEDVAVEQDQLPF